MSESRSQGTSLSLRNRLLLIGGFLLISSLGLVGYGLDLAFSKRVEVSVRTQLENYFHLALAATEIRDDGSINVSDSLTDPRLTQPGSGLYLRIQVPGQVWDSPSAIDTVLPESRELEGGESHFHTAESNGGFFALHQGISWLQESGELVPMTVTAWESEAGPNREMRQFRRGLWRWLGGAGLLLLLAQGLLFIWAVRPLDRITRDVAAIPAGSPR